jgi:hypothetical protein
MDCRTQRNFRETPSFEAFKKRIRNSIHENFQENYADYEVKHWGLKIEQDWFLSIACISKRDKKCINYGSTNRQYCCVGMDDYLNWMTKRMRTYQEVFIKEKSKDELAMIKDKE